jgi:hypothetical protein
MEYVAYRYVPVHTPIFLAHPSQSNSNNKRNSQRRRETRKKAEDGKKYCKLELAEKEAQPAEEK